MTTPPALVHERPLQFPEWFVPNMEKRAYLESLKARLPGYRLAVEFRDTRETEPGGLATLRNYL